MPNTAFRIAFWALFISLGLSLTAAVLSPRMSMVQALRAETDTVEGLAAHQATIHLGHPVAFPTDHRTAAANPDEFQLHIPAPPPVSPEPVVEPTPEIEQLVPSPYPLPQEEPLVGLEGSTVEDLRIAQREPGDEYVSAEMLAPNPPRGVYEELPPPPVEDAIAVHRDDSRDILAQIQELREELARIQLLQLRRETALALKSLQEDVCPGTRLEHVAMTSAAEAPVQASDMPSAEPSTAWVPLKSSTAVSVESPEDASLEQSAPVQSEAPQEPAISKSQLLESPVFRPDRYVRISPGEQASRWTFEFKETPVDEVLMVLGDHAGTEVVVESGLEGVYSHTFTEADPKQAFASVVKSFRLGIDMKGDYIFVRRSVIR